MSARDELIEIVTSHPESSGGDPVWATDLVDAHRAEVLNEAADMVHAMADPQCTCGGCDSCAARGYAKALREKATAAAATATPASGPVIDELRRLVRAAAPLWGAPGRYCDADIDSEANRIYLAVRAEILAAERGDAQ